MATVIARGSDGRGGLDLFEASAFLSLLDLLEVSLSL
jgi:hypothetical protein